MAKKTFIVVEDSFIGMRLIKADSPLADRVVEVELDVDKGGMSPGSNLMPAVFNDSTGQWEIETIAAGKPAKAKKAAAPAEGDSTDLV